jgi:hypothetical protein
MEFLPNDKFKIRFLDIFGNLFAISDQGKIGPRQVPGEGEYWTILFTHILEEAKIRGLGLPAMNDADRATSFPNSKFETIDKAIHALAGKLPKPGTVIIKFGKRIHLEEAYESGTFQVSAASSYSDPSLNPAIRDSELEIAIERLPTEMKIEAFDHKTGKSKGPIKPIGNVLVTSQITTDYYVFCVSRACEYRLFQDFEADGCLIIRNPKEFERRILAAVKEVLPDWIEGTAPVRYIDPLNAMGQPDVSLSKHFRYSYQKEYRFAWLPPSARRELEPFFISLGSLADIGELIMI